MNTEQTNIEMPKLDAEQTPNVGIENAPIAESIHSSPVQATTQAADDVSVAKIDEIEKTEPALEAPEVHADSEITTREDLNWANKVREVINEDKDDPYKEEQDSEKLQEDYMKSRFNIDVDNPEGE